MAASPHQPPDRLIDVWVNCPARAVADRIAEAAIGGRLAGCANLLPPVASLYRWKGAVERAEEVPLVLKTRAGHFDALVALARSLHPYETPSIVAMPLDAVEEDYARWLREETLATEAGGEYRPRRAWFERLVEAGPVAIKLNAICAEDAAIDADILARAGKVIAGAAGTIAMAKLARAAPDGYTIGIGHVGTNVANAVIYAKLGFDLVNDLEPIARLPANAMLVVSSNNVPAKTLKELVDYLKANPDKASGGTAGIGSGAHLGALAFNKAPGVSYQLVPYRGTGPAMQDLIANQIQVMVDQSANSLPQVQGGKIRAYAVTSAKRSPAMPDIPTAAEAGYPMEVSIWNGLWAPKGTPKDIVDKLNAAAIAALADPAVRKRMDELGLDTPTAEEMKPSAFAAFQKAELARWKPILEAAGVKAE